MHEVTTTSSLKLMGFIAQTNQVLFGNGQAFTAVMFEHHYLFMKHTPLARGKRANCPFRTSSLLKSAANGMLIAFILLETVRLSVWLHIINLCSLFICMFIKTAL